MDSREILIGSILIGIFIISIILFGVQLSLDNGASENILNNSAINNVYSSLNDEITGSQATTEAGWESLRQDIPTESSDLSLLSIPKIAASLPSIIHTIFKSIFTLFSEALGIPPIILYGLTTILFIVIITAIWSVIKIGK